MAKRAKKNTAKKTSQQASNGLNASYWTKALKPRWQWASAKQVSTVVYIQFKDSPNELKKNLKPHLLAWQLEKLLKDTSSGCLLFSGHKNEVWILRPYIVGVKSKKGFLEDTDLSQQRALLGEWYRSNAHKIGPTQILFSGKEPDLYQTLYTFLIADYNPAKTLLGEVLPSTELSFSGNLSASAFTKAFNKALQFAGGQNLSRHLTNLPPNILNPKSFSQLPALLFKGNKSVDVNVWGPDRLYKENCHLLYHVGLGSEHGSHLVHIRYRPKGKSKKPLVFVGKGVTFDTGGLDIKPSDGMRFMKKDMSGAGVVLGLAYACIHSQQPHPMDFYLAITENSVSEKATRPSDIHHSRSGKRIEIHNTDAEGRLAMADALALACEKTGLDEAEFIIDVSTLTGAMRISVGLDVAGYFCNDEALVKKIEKAAITSGEMVWRQPLVAKYTKHFSSRIADMTNCSNTPFGGAITAALFLEKFINNKKWAHFDVMAWNGSGDGALSEGGNGQSFMTLSELVQSY